MPVTLHVVTKTVGIYETYTTVEGVFSTYEKAEAFIKTRRGGDYDIHDEILDAV